MKNIAIITARSGSKGLADKNIRNLNGKPLMAYTIETALESKCFDTVMVSTDSEKYAQIAREYGAEVPFLRSAENSSDTAGSWEVVNEVLNNYKEKEKKFDTVCLLQPTSPLRLSDDIKNGYLMYEEKMADAITAVCEAEHSMGVYLTLPTNASMQSFREKHGFYLPRQSQEKLYRINGALYIRRVVYEKGYIKTVSNREFAYVMSKDRSVDIDNEFDFTIIKAILREECVNRLEEHERR